MRISARLLLGLGVGVFLALSVISIRLPQRVYAEAPRCFQHSNVGDAAFHSVDCNSSSYNTLITSLTGAPPQDDQCYNIGELSVDKRPVTSDACKKWIADADATNSVPANCIAIDGSMGDWSEGKIQDLNLYHPNAKCTDYIDRIKAAGFVVSEQTFQNGQCYLLFKESDAKYTYRQTECGQGLESLIVHTQISNPDQVIPTADRETVVHCGEHGETTAECLAANPLVKMLNNIVSFVSAGVGVIVVIMVIIGGIQYVTAGNNPQAVAAAKKRIYNALIALVAFLLIFSFMNWLIPGGIL